MSEKNKKNKNVEGPFNPFTQDIVEYLVEVFETRPLETLPPSHLLPGCGVYALYYLGEFKPYQLLPNRERVPIYVGKAVAPGGRKGCGVVDPSKGNYVIKRLREHSNTITQTKNLKIGDFNCRWLSVDPHFVGAAESILISHYQPIWNRLIAGFGIHTPGKGRLKQARSDWDMLHPGRGFALELPEGNSIDLIIERLKQHGKSQKKL